MQPKKKSEGQKNIQIVFRVITFHQLKPTCGENIFQENLCPPADINKW